MKHLLLFIVLITAINLHSQNIKKIAAYDNNSSYTSGLYCINDTSVFRYSWYYEEWFPLESDGLTITDDTIRVSSIAVYNNKINNSSGIFVFSDTAVFNYNWFSQTWYPLENTGLPRDLNNKPDIYDLTVYGDSGSSSNSELFALTNSGIYRYIWFYQEWYPLSNTGLQVKTNNTEKNSFSAGVFPNPSSNDQSIEINLPDNITRQVCIAVFDDAGKVVYNDKISGSGNILYKLNTEKLGKGIYYCEIKAGDIFKTIIAVRI